MVKKTSSSASLALRVVSSPTEVEPRAAIATRASATSTPSVVSRAVRPRGLLSIAG